MPQFTDDWVVDRAMFEYVNSGGCSCCGISHMGMDMMQFMAACSDLETDDGKKEVQVSRKGSGVERYETKLGMRETQA